MKSTAQFALDEKSGARYSDVAAEKSTGSTYTPRELASFVARQIVNVGNLESRKKIRVLDPAVGDGALLKALIDILPATVRNRIEVTGFDTDMDALVRSEGLLKDSLRADQVRVSQQDFISYVLNVDGVRKLSASDSENRFDVVIANPPYVRTQIMGADVSQQIARRFGLAGRVDLYYAFLVGISQVLAPDGVAGVITSNRFMTTKSGQSIRRALLSDFEIVHAWDLGDTKIFEAAVLPAILLVRGRNTPLLDVSSREPVLFSSIYETEAAADMAATEPLSALAASDATNVSIPDGRHFHVRHGVLDNGGSGEGVWRVATRESDHWLATVQARTWGTFRQIGKIRVGVKSTADKIFIRSDWDSLPGGRPELLRPLVTRRSARRYRPCVPANPKHLKEILYPHEVSREGSRAAVDLDKFPISKDYLEQHRSALEARTYVISAGRRWYELWVPQDPEAWRHPKLVFPDISDKPIFWMDLDGGVVNGECYWLQPENPNNQDLLWLALAIANSSFIVYFYDHRFNNKLYAGRRRFITQYVEEFPVLDPDLPASKEIVALTKRIFSCTPSDEADELARALDRRVWEAFGLTFEEVST